MPLRRCRSDRLLVTGLTILSADAATLVAEGDASVAPTFDHRRLTLAGEGQVVRAPGGVEIAVPPSAVMPTDVELDTSPPSTHTEPEVSPTPTALPVLPPLLMSPTTTPPPPALAVA